MSIFKSLPLAVAITAAFTTAAAEQPTLLESGKLAWNGEERQLVGVRPAGEDWPARWRDALKYQNWAVEVTDGGIRLTSGQLELSELLMAMDAAVPAENASQETLGFKEYLDDRKSVESSTAFTLDGNLYTPASVEYQLDSGLVIINTGRSLYCASQGDSEGHPTPPVTAIIDSRLVPLDGRNDVNPIEYELSAGIVHVKSSHADMWCGPPDAVRLTMSAPEEAAPNAPAHWTLRATNHSDSAIEDLQVTAEWSPEATIQAGSECNESDETLTCNEVSLAPGEQWEKGVEVAAPQGGLLGTCEGSMASTGRVSDENCWANSDVSMPVWVEADRVGPSTVQPGTPFLWDITLTNSGSQTAEDVQLVDIVIPGDSVHLVKHLQGATCTASESDSVTTVSCDLDDSIPPGGQQIVQLEMRIDSVGAYNFQCQVQWQGGQENEPEACEKTIAVESGEVIFKSRFELD